MNKHFVPLSNIKRLHLELGYFCNIRCIMCYQDNFKSKTPKYIWKEKLLPVYPNLKELIMYGGEITAMPESRELMELVEKHNPNILFGTSTNGLLFNDYWQDKFLTNGSEVNFSLNATDEKTYKTIAKYSDYKKVMSNLKSLISKKNKLNSKLKTIISLTIRPENIHQLADFIKLGKELGIGEVRFYFDRDNLCEDITKTETNVGQAWDMYKKSNTRMEGLAAFYNYYCQKKKITNIYLNEQDSSVDEKNCPNPWQSIHVDKDGNVRACCKTYLIFGNLKKENIEKIWNSFWAKALRKDVKTKKYCYCMPSCPYVEHTYSKFSYAGFKILLYMMIQEPATVLKKISKIISKIKK